MNITIRPEHPEEFAVTENLTREAFYNVNNPGCEDHYLLHIMHESDVLIQELNLVAEQDGKIIGNVICTRARIEGAEKTWTDVLGLGPIAVLPEFQRQGVGGALIREAARRAGKMGFRAILLYGSPDYYPKQGFVPAERYGVCTGDDMYADALHAMELYPGALDGVTGRFFEDEIFEIDGKAAQAFEAQFPPKEKLEGTPSQVRFQEIIKLRRPVK